MTEAPLGLKKPLQEQLSSVRYPVVVFDFHGTMTDHQLRNVRAHFLAADKLGLPRWTREFYEGALTRPSQTEAASQKESHASREEIRAQRNSEFIEEELRGRGYDEETIKNYKRTFRETMGDIYMPIPGIIEVVDTLTAQGVEIALLTNGSNRKSIKTTLERWGLADISENRLYSSHNMAGMKKPNPETIERVLTDIYRGRSDLQDMNEVLIIGDYIDDIATAVNSGAHSVLMVRGNGGEPLKLREPKPTYVVTDPKEILAIVHGKREPVTTDEILIPKTLWARVQTP